VRGAAFASDAIALGKRTRLLAGLRFDAIGDSLENGDGPTLTAWSPRVGLTVLAGPDVSPATIYVQVSRAFKAPTLDQLFDPRPYPDFTGGTFSISNPDLRPQRATNVEAGASGGQTIRWNAAAYWMAVEDEIDFDVNTFSYGNIGDSRHTGVELGAQLEDRVIRPYVSYSWSRVTAKGDDFQLKNIPAHSFVAGAAVSLPKAVAVTGIYRRLWGGYLDDESTFPLDGRSTIDARVRVPFGRIAAVVDMWNLTGNRYEEYGFVLSDFTGQPTGYAYPGAGRAVRVGIDFTF
jgi:outer membrane receptor protein involved in Fe transport